MKLEIEVLRRKKEEQKLRAERDALHVEVARGARGGGGAENQQRGILNRLLLCQHLGWQPNQARRKYLCLVRTGLN